MKNKKTILLVIVCVLASAGIGMLLAHHFDQKVERTVNASVDEAAEDAVIVKNGVRYEPDKGGIHTYLFLGVDDADRTYEGYGTGGRTDTILLLIQRNDTIRILEISRDTMTEVDTYDADGNYLSSGVMQINMQYSFGDSPRRSAYLTKKTVSELLGGVEILGSISLNMSGIQPVVDAMGGIDIHMEEDCSYIDPAYTEDAEVHMDGAEAERFIRWRDLTESGSNDARMSRHTWFIRQMLSKADNVSVAELLKAAEPYLNTDLTADEICELYDCKLVETIRLPGETRAGGRHDEFYVDANALEDLLLKLFYNPIGTEN